MGSGQTPWADLAYTLGRGLAAMNVHLLTGGGAGVMTSVSEGFTSQSPRAGLAIGIVPTEPRSDHSFSVKDGYPNPFIELPIITPLGVYAGIDPYQISRNHINIMTSDFIIALPGSGGTHNEIDLGLRFHKPVCLLGPHDLPDGFENIVDRFDKVEDALVWVGTHIARKESTP